MEKGGPHAFKVKLTLSLLPLLLPLLPFAFGAERGFLRISLQIVSLSISEWQREGRRELGRGGGEGIIGRRGGFYCADLRSTPSALEQNFRKGKKTGGGRRKISRFCDNLFLLFSPDKRTMGENAAVISGKRPTVLGGQIEANGRSLEKLWCGHRTCFPVIT